MKVNEIELNGIIVAFLGSVVVTFFLVMFFVL